MHRPPETETANPFSFRSWLGLTRARFLHAFRLRETPAPSASHNVAAAQPNDRIRGWNIAQRLSLIGAVAALPMLLLSMVTVWELAKLQRDSSRQGIMYSAHSIVSAVDAQLGKYVAVAEALAASPSIQLGDLAAFREEAVRALSGLPGSWATLTTARGQQVVNILVPAEAPIPPVPPSMLADITRAFETKQLHVSNVFIGQVAKIPAIGIAVPVFRDGTPAYFLSVSVDATVFQTVLNQRHLPAGWIAGIIDRNGNFIARSRDHQSFVGKSAPPDWREHMRETMIFEGVTYKGVPLIRANAVSELSGWAIAVGVEKWVFDAPIKRIFETTGLTGLALTLLSALFAGWAARKITMPINALKRAAQALQQREPVSFAATRMPEVDRALAAFEAASKDLIAHEKALEESEERFRLLVEGTKDYAVYALDPDGCVASWNEGGRRLQGYDTDEVLGRHLSVFYASPEVAARELDIALRTGACEQECERIRKDGTHFFANSLTTPLFDKNGKLKGYSKITRDITEQKRAQEALKASEKLMHLFIDEAPAPIAMFDRNMRYLAASRRWLACFCPDEQDIVGRSHYELFPEVPERWKELHRRGFAGEVLRGSEDPFMRSDGRTQWVSWEIRPWHAADGTVGGIVIFADDVTDMKRAEEEHRRLQAELLHATRLTEIGRMAAAFAHELNQPLTAVASYIGGCRRILRSGVDERRARKVQEMMDQANAQALRAGEIIRHLREFIGSGQRERTIESAADVMREASALAMTAARHKGVSIRSNIRTDAQVLVDKIQFQQVIVNLVRNAIEAMETTPRKELKLELAATADGLEFSVADTGAGITQEIADRLFRPFSSTKSHGMGIGLSVCREIVEAHDGKIWAEPNPDGGTVFRFVLPSLSKSDAMIA